MSIEKKYFTCFQFIPIMIFLHSCATSDSIQNSDNKTIDSDQLAEDTQLPEIIAISPTDQTTEIDSTTNIRVFFSEAIQQTSLSVTNGNCGGSIQLTKNNFESCEDINLQLSADGKELVIFPTKDYDFLTIYSIRLSQSITDLSGNSLESAYLSSFQTEHSPGLGDTISSRLQKNLSDPGLLSENQTLLITSSGASALENEYLQYSEDPSKVLPSYLEGSLIGIGQVGLNNDNQTSEIISITTETITSLIGEFEEKLLVTVRTSRSETMKEAFELLLESLVATAIGTLEQTGLSTESQTSGLGVLVGAMIGSLDEAKTASVEISSAIQRITKKAVQEAAKVPEIDLSTGIKSISKSSIKALGKTGLEASEINNVMGETVGSVVDVLDEIECQAGSVELSFSNIIAEVSESSLEGFAELSDEWSIQKPKETLDLEGAVASITSGTIRSVQSTVTKNSELDLGVILKEISKKTSATLGSLVNDVESLIALNELVQGQIKEDLESTANENPSLGFNLEAVLQNVSNGLNEGAIESGVEGIQEVITTSLPEPTP